MTQRASTAEFPPAGVDSAVLRNGGDGSWMWTHLGRIDSDSLEEVAIG